jgi:hypothetical protein
LAKDFYDQGSKLSPYAEFLRPKEFKFKVFHQTIPLRALAPDSRDEAVSHMALYSLRKSIGKSPKSPKSDPTVSMTPRDPTFFIRIPL